MMPEPIFKRPSDYNKYLANLKNAMNLENIMMSYSGQEKFQGQHDWCLKISKILVKQF